MRAAPRVGDRWPKLGGRGEGWIGIQTLGILAVFVGGWLAPSELDGAARAVGVVAGFALMGAGIGLFAWGSRQLGHLFSIWVAPRPGGHVVTSGPYRFVRHPVCAGQVVIALGYALVRANLVTLALAALYLAIVAVKVTREEAWLRAAYPDYAAFMERTRSRLIPGLF